MTKYFKDNLSVVCFTHLRGRLHNRHLCEANFVQTSTPRAMKAEHPYLINTVAKSIVKVDKVRLSVNCCTTYSGLTTDDSYRDHGAQQQPNNIATCIKRNHQVYGGAFWLESQDALVFWG